MKTYGHKDIPSIRKPRLLRMAVLAVVLGISQAKADWPGFRGPTLDGKAAAGPPLMKAWPENGPRQLWVNSNIGYGYSSAAVTRDGIYITGMEGDQGFLYALDMNGKQRWKTTYGRDWDRGYRGARSTPTIRNGKAYLMSGYGTAACFDAATGRNLWTVDMMAKFGARNITWGMAESPLVLDDKVIFSPGGTEAGIVALHPDTGKTIWVCADVNDRSGYCSPFLIEWGGRRIIVQLMGTVFVGVEEATGRLLWRQPRDPVPSHNIQAVPPVYADGRFYITTGYGGRRGVLYRLNAEGTGVTRVWQDSELDCHHGGVILHNGFIYGASDRNNRNHWICLNFEDGSVAGKIPGVGKGSVAFAEGMLYMFSERGTVGLANADPADFRLVSSFKLPGDGRGPFWAHPSIAHGRLYLRHGSSLFAYDISAR